MPGRLVVGNTIAILLIMMALLLGACTDSKQNTPSTTGRADASATAIGAPDRKTATNVTPGQASGAPLLIVPFANAIVTDTIAVRGTTTDPGAQTMVGVTVNGNLVSKEPVNLSSAGGQTSEFTATIKLSPVSTPTDAQVVLFTAQGDNGSTTNLAQVPIKLVPPDTSLVQEPSIRLMPDHGGSGTQIVIVGDHFTPGGTIEIRLSGVTTEATNAAYASTTVDQAGMFKISFTMPAYWPNGDPIVQPQIVVLASTPDFIEKSSAVFSYDSKISTQNLPADNRMPTGVAASFVNAWINSNANEMLSYVDAGFRNSIGGESGVLVGAARLFGVQNVPASATFMVARAEGPDTVVRATLHFASSTTQAEITLHNNGSAWKITKIEPVK